MARQAQSNNVESTQTNTSPSQDKKSQKNDKIAEKKARDAEIAAMQANITKVLNNAKYADDTRTVPRDILQGFEPFAKFKKNGTDISFKMFARDSGVPEDLYKFCLDLTEKNMASLYEEAGWGWNPKKKKREITEDDARLLVAFDNETSAPVAFANFRFIREGDVLVLYLYELQVIAEFARKGLGKHIMLILELAARKYEMEWVMLTVLNCNESASKFYSSLKYVIDETSPQVIIDEGDDASYQIMSKCLFKKNN